jgi:hypothetical protein
MSLNPSAPNQLSGADPHLIGFEEAKRDLLMADSVNERANAAFKLGLIGNSAGVAYLIAALYDNEAEVRNAAAESLGQIGDASALGPLIDLQHREGSNAGISNAISLIGSREKNLVSANGESAEFEELESTPEEAATLNQSTQLHTETQADKNFLTEAVAEINTSFNAAAEQAERINDARDKYTINNSHADEVASQPQPHQQRTATTISDEIDAGFEVLRQAEARQSELIAEAEARLHEQQEARHKVEVSVRQRAEQEKRLAEEIEALQVTEQELGQRVQEAEERRRLQCEAVRQTKEEMRACAEEENLRLAELEEQRHHAEEESRERAEQEQHLENSIALLVQTASEQKDRIAEAEAQIAETLRTLKADEERHVAEAQAALKSQREMRKQAAAKAKQRSKQVQRLSQEIEALDNDAEEQAKKIAASEAEFARAQEAALAQSEAEGRLREEVKRLQEAEAETRWALEATERAVANLRSQVETEERRLAELAEIKQQTEAEAQQRAAREADMKRQLRRLDQAEQQQGKRLQKAETSLQAKQKTLNQIEAELQRLAEEEALRDCHIASLRETLQQVETESQDHAGEEELRINEIAELRSKSEAELSQRKEFEQQLTAELEALRATCQNQLKAISELETSVQKAQDEAQQLTAIEADLNRQLSSLADHEDELARRLQTAEAALQFQQQTCNQLETECQQRAEDEELQLATLAATRERAAVEEQRRALQREQLSAELAALRAAEENQIKVIKKLEVNVQQTRTKAEELITREAQLNAEIQTLQAKFTVEHESQTAAAARRAEQEDSLKEMDATARLLAEQEAIHVGQLQALRNQLELESQQRLEDERQLNLAIEALRVGEIEQLSRLEDLRKHAAAQEEAEQLRVLEESRLSAEIAAVEASISNTEETYHTNKTTVDIEASQRQESEQLIYPEQTEAEEPNPLAADCETVVWEASSLVVELGNEEETAKVEPLIISTDSFSFELSNPVSRHEEEIVICGADFEMPTYVDQVEVSALEPVAVEVDDQAKSLSLVTGETGLTQVNEDSPLSQAAARLQSSDPAERCEALMNLSQLGPEESFDLIATRFDDPSVQVRNAAARALCELDPDRAASLTRALREAQPERRRRIGAAFAGSGLASQAINCLAGEGRDVTYDAFTVLFLMAKAGEVHPLIETIENHANIAVRLAVIKLLAFSNQAGVVPTFRRLAVRASLPAEVRSAVMEAIHDIGTPSRESRISAA